MFRYPTLDPIVLVVHKPPGYLGVRERLSVETPQWLRVGTQTHAGDATEGTTKRAGEL